jgi:adenine deaminase
MKRIALAVALSMSLSGCKPPVSIARSTDTAPQSVIAITPVTIIDVKRGLALHGQTVVVRDSQIVAVRSAQELSIPSDAIVLNGTGKFLSPGFADMHVLSTLKAICSHTLPTALQQCATWPATRRIFVCAGVS